MGGHETVVDPDAGADEARKLSTVGRYVILESIGMGGMGVVCSAYDPKLDRRIALKLLRSTSGGQATETGRNRLFREAQALAKLTHPNVVTVHDVGDFEGQVYIAMEFVEGTTLREWLRERPRDWREILDKFVEAGRGLAAAHAAGIIHRDFKPANVLISRSGDVRVADFGVAKERERSARPERDMVGLRRETDSADGLETTGEEALIEEMLSSADKQLTVAGRMVGTPAYMAPEQLMGLKVGPFTDQYSFCVCLYEALYGRLPFEGGDRVERLRRMTEGRLPPPPKDERSRAVPAWLHKVLAQGLRPQATERWPSMDLLLAALQRDPARRFRRVFLVGLALLGVTIGTLGFVYGRGTEPSVDVCQGVGDEMLEHWNDARATELRTAFAKADVPYADDSATSAIARLDLWAANWQVERRRVCEATWVRGDQSPQLLDLRILCLDRRLSDFDALLAVFAEADAGVVERAIAAAHGLADPAECSTIRDSGEANARSTDPDTREKLDALSEELSRAVAIKSAAAQYEESLPLLQSVVDQARALFDEAMLAQALYELAEAQSETGAGEDAEASLREAVLLAARLDDPAQEAKIWSRLMFTVGYGQHRQAEAKAWALAADAAIVRAGDSPELRARLEGSLGAVRFDEGDSKAAIDHYRRSFDLWRRSVGPKHPATVRALANFGIALGRAQEDKNAEAILREALKGAIALYGESHPQVGSAYLNLGNVLQHAGKHEEAEKAIRAALVIAEADGGPDSEAVGRILNTLALVEHSNGRVTDALDNLERAAGIFTAQDPKSVSLAVTYTNIGRFAGELGQFEDARVAFDEAEAIYKVLYPPLHPRHYALARFRCTMLVAQGAWDEAAQTCESAITMDEQLGEAREPGALIELLELLAKAEDGRGRPQAAERARERAAEVAAAEAKAAAEARAAAEAKAAANKSAVELPPSR
jgi:tetratricopeptide (TPR) repeat protein/tRNA A-37 threonylcarbamoyl transferase component Bud32